MATDSPVKDEATEATFSFEIFSKETEGKEDLDLNQYLTDKFNSDADLAEEYLKDNDAFVKKYLTAPEAGEEKKDPPEKEKTPEEKAAEEAAAAEGGADKEKTPEEKAAEEAAAAEAEKATDPKDGRIQFLEDERNKNSTELERLKRENADLKTKKPAAEKKKPEEKPLPEIEIPEFSDDEDVYSEAYQKKVQKAVKASASEIVRLRTENQKLKTEAAEAKETASQAVTKADETAQESAAATSVNAEFIEADKLRKRYNGHGLTFKRSTQEIQDDYISFMRDLHSVAGVEGPLLDEQGNYSPGVAKAFVTYRDKVKGEELRNLCATKDIKLPDDFDDLMDVYNIRRIRQRTMEETGGSKLPSYEMAFSIYAKDEGRLSDMQKKLDMSTQEAASRAVKNRQEKPKETDSTHGSSPVDLTKITDQDFSKLMAKPDKSDEDKEYLRKIMKAIHAKDPSVFSDYEIEELLADKPTGG